jgi:hypothetical protein
MGDAMKFVFCEGKDDVAVVRSLASHLKLVIQVEEYGGKNNLPLFLESVSKRPEFAQQKVTGLAILRDANGDSAGAFASVRDALQRNGFPHPDSDAAFSESALRVGIFIVGINGRGMIEDVCLKSVSDRPDFSCVDDYFNCIARKSSRSNFSSKAKSGSGWLRRLISSTTSARRRKKVIGLGKVRSLVRCRIF